MRKSSLGMVAAIALLMCAPASSSFAWSHGGGWHGGGWHGGGWHGGGTHVVVGVGAPFWGWGLGWGPWYGPGPGYYPYGYGYGYDYGYGYAYPPAVVVQPGYTQQAQPLPSGYWYFCPTSNDYYPHVQTCNQPWVPVPPTPSE